MSQPFEKLPIFEDFGHTASFAEMADILIQAPPALLDRYSMTLRNRLMHRRFPEAIDYLDHVSSAMNRVRTPDGMMSMEAQEVLLSASNRMTAAAKAHDAAREGGEG